MTRRTSLFALLAVFGIGLGTRLFPLWWSPLPATLDGFVYAQDARITLANGGLVLEGVTADALTSTVVLSLGAEITGAPPRHLAQPLYATAGAATVLLGVLFVRRLGTAWGWRPDRIRTAAVIAAFALAVEGLFVRRTGVPDDDAFTLLLIPLLAYVLYRVVDGGSARWLLPFALIAGILPFTHTFSTLVAALSVLVVLATALLREPLTRRSGVSVVLVGGFWLYFAAYYEWAEAFGLVVPYVGRITAHPGLFVAWVIALVFGALLFQRASVRLKRTLVLVPLGLFFGVVLVNTQTAVFPGTSRTPTLVLALVAPLVIPAAVAAWGGPLLGRRLSVGTVLLGLLLAPLVLVLFSLTAALTPEFSATAMRAQTHLHVPVLVLAGMVVASARGRIGKSTSRAEWTNALHAALATLVIVAVVATLPLAYVNLDTGSYPSTTTAYEWEGATFVADRVTGQATTAHNLMRVTRLSRTDSTVSVSMEPTATWLRGGPPPGCAVLSVQSWTSTGAHLFPAAPETIAPEAYDRWIAQRQLIYANTGVDPVVVTVPRANRAGC